MKSKTIKIIFLAACAITLTLWLLAKPISSNINEPELALAQIAGLIGITSLAFNFFLASRFVFLDKLMGGLDKVFKFHRFTGKLAFTLMLAHPLLLIASLPSLSLAKFYLYPHSGFFAENFGMFALWGFTILIVATLFVKMPYHIWKATHKLMGIPFLLVAIHVITIESDVSRFMPLRAWILSLIIAGFSLYIYKVFLYRFIGPRHKYIVTQVRRLGAITEVHLKPAGKKMAFRAGQFAFLKLKDKQIGREEHPFTISSAPESDELRLSIKASGDYTERLQSLKEGTSVTVYGPYGRFGEPYLEREGESIWIAGGIGVTPFLSLMRHAKKQAAEKPVTLYYSTKNPDEMVYKNELEEAASELKSVTFVPHFSETEGYLEAKKIAKTAGDIKKKKIFLCGPPVMMRSLTKAFVEQGVPRKNIFFEDFSLR